MFHVKMNMKIRKLHPEPESNWILRNEQIFSEENKIILVLIFWHGRTKQNSSDLELF